MNQVCKLATLALIVAEVGCSGVINNPDGGLGTNAGTTGSTSSSGTSGSSGSSGSSGGSGSSGSTGNPTAGFTVKSGVLEIIPGVIPTSADQVIQPDGGSPDPLPLPYTFSWSGAQPGGPVSGSETISQSGNTLNYHMVGSAVSTVTDQNSAILVSAGYIVCYTSPGATSMDFVYTGSGTVSGNGGAWASTATFGDGSSLKPSAAIGETDSGGIGTGAWTPASYTNPNMTAQNGTACDNAGIGGESITLFGGEINGLGNTGTATADVTFTVTVTVH
jgi:hypothetical protein